MDFIYLILNTQKCDNMSVEEFIKCKDEELHYIHTNCDVHFDMLYSTDVDLMKEVMKGIDVKLKTKTVPHKYILNAALNKAGAKDFEEFYMLFTEGDIFKKIEIENMFTYKELSYILNSFVAVEAHYDFEPDEIVVAISLDDFVKIKDTNVDSFKTWYNQKMMKNENLMIVPPWAKLARTVKWKKANR